MTTIEKENSILATRIIPETSVKTPLKNTKDKSSKALDRKVLNSLSDLDSLFPTTDTQNRSATSAVPITQAKPDKVSASYQKFFGRNDNREVGNYSRRETFAPGQDPYVINGQIIKSETLEQLHQIYLNQGQAFNHINLCTWVHRVAKKSSDTYQKLPEDLPDNLRESLKSVAEKMIPHVKSFDQRAVANAAWAFAKLGIKNEKLFHKISERASQLVDTMDGQAVSNLCWAFATLGIRDLLLFDNLAHHVIRV